MLCNFGKRRRSPSDLPPQAFQEDEEILAATVGERKPFTEVWRQQDNAGKPVPAGTYEVVAVLTTMARPQPRTGTLTIRLGG